MSQPTQDLFEQVKKIGDDGLREITSALGFDFINDSYVVPQNNNGPAFAIKYDDKSGPGTSDLGSDASD